MGQCLPGLRGHSPNQLVPLVVADRKINYDSTRIESLTISRTSQRLLDPLRIDIGDPRGPAEDPAVDLESVINADAGPRSRPVSDGAGALSIWTDLHKSSTRTTKRSNIPSHVNDHQRVGIDGSMGSSCRPTEEQLFRRVSVGHRVDRSRRGCCTEVRCVEPVLIEEGIEPSLSLGRNGDLFPASEQLRACHLQF